MSNLITIASITTLSPAVRQACVNVVNEYAGITSAIGYCSMSELAKVLKKKGVINSATAQAGWKHLVSMGIAEQNNDGSYWLSGPLAAESTKIGTTWRFNLVSVIAIISNLHSTMTEAVAKAKAMCEYTEGVNTGEFNVEEEDDFSK